MNVSNAGAVPVPQIQPTTPQPTQAASKDSDGDSDNSGGAMKSATAPGVGQSVDMGA